MVAQGRHDLLAVRATGHDLDEFLRADAQRRAGRAGAHAGGTRRAGPCTCRTSPPSSPGPCPWPWLPCPARAQAEQQPGQQAGLAPFGIQRRHLDHAVGAVALAVAAADAAVGDEDLAVRRAVDRIRRAILHAVRMLAMPARGRHVHLREGRPGLAIEPRGAAMGIGAGLLAVVAAHAQRLRRSAGRRSLRRRPAASGR